MPAPAEAFPSAAHNIYPGISPEKFIGTNKGRVAFITGSSKGLGLGAAQAFAASGASLFLSARSGATLEKVKAELETEYKVPVAYAVVDITKEESVKTAVAKAIETYGKIDIVISNAGGGEVSGVVGGAPVDEWFGSLEVNLKGTYTVVTHTLPELRKTKGYLILLASVLANIRLPLGSAYNISKLTVIRLAEWIHTENTAYGVKSIAIHPGAVATDFSAELISTNPAVGALFSDPPELQGWTQVRLTSGSEDWLSGRFFDSTWSLDEIAKYKESIIEDDALKLRLALPHSK